MNREPVCDITGLLRKPGDAIECVKDVRSALKGVAFLLALTALGAAVFGFALGSFANVGTGLWASLKLAGVVLFAFVLTGPSLYVFTVVCGCGLSAIRIIVFGLVVTATLGCLLASLAPILWIFTVSTESMAFIIVFSFILSVTAMGVAFRAVWRGPAAGPVRGAFVVWAVLYVVVALQTVTLLRPMLGPSDEECGESRQKCFFVEHFFESVGE